MRRMRLAWLMAAVLGLVVIVVSPAGAIGLDPAYDTPTLGPERAKGVVIWSHGRSRETEDSSTATPPYLGVLRDDGWDVMRFNRLRRDDTLMTSAQRLVDHVAGLKRNGYRRVLLAGQSFGGFLALMAADASNDVTAVIVTAPAAFGRFDDASDHWRLNAARLYPLLEEVKRARVMVFFFHGDDFDPGGRGDRARAILSGRGLGYAVIDQPSYLTGHWAASSGLFLRRFGDCLRDFATDDELAREFACAPRWGVTPSAELKLPPELAGPPPAATAPASSGGSLSPGVASRETAGSGVEAWYGFYPNGRELLLAIESRQGGNLEAIYAVGPSIDGKYPSTWSRRAGRTVDDAMVFEEGGKNTLRFRPRGDGGLAATWISHDGKTTLAAQLRRIDPRSLARREAAK